MTDEELFTLTGLFYEGILSPQGWQPALNRLASITSSGAASLVLWDRRADQAVVGDQIGLPDELLREYAAHFHTLDPGRNFVDRLALGGWYMDERDLGMAGIRHSGFYQDFLKRYELDSTMASPFLRAENGLDGFLSLSSAAGKRNLPQVARMLARLMPHLQQAARLRLKLLALSQQAELQAHILDRFDFPLVAVTADKRVMLANRLGEQWLATPGNPMAAGSTYAGQIAKLLQEACGPDGSRKASGLQIRKPAGGKYYLTAVPLPIQSSAAWQSPAPMALLLVADPEQEKQPAGELLRQIFRLTPAEIRLVRPLLQGATLQEATAGLGISIDTGRTQLKSIFAKLGIRRQTDLHRLLGRIQIVEQE